MKLSVHNFMHTILIAASIFIFGCGASVSGNHWRDDATARFNTAISAGAAAFAPEETDNIRQTLALADRYYKSSLIEDADRLYQLSCQKSQLLYRNLVVSKIRQGVTIGVQSAKNEQGQELKLADEPISLQQIVDIKQNEDDDDDDDAETIEDSEQMAELLPSQTPIKNVPVDTNKTEPTVISDKSPKVIPPKIKTPKQLPSPHTVKPVAKKIATKTDENIKNKYAAKGRTLYLTFDDGPSRLTLPIANYLKANGITATFFALGSNIKGRERILESVVAMGHKVGNHTLSHNLKKLNASFNQSKNEVQRTGAMIDNIGGDGKLVRIPYGASNKTLVSNIKSGGAQIFDWDINSNDSTQKGVKNHQIIEQTVIKHLRQTQKRHLILLFHDGSGHDSTLTALKSLIPKLKQEGYGFGVLARHENIASAAVRNQKNP